MSGGQEESCEIVYSSVFEFEGEEDRGDIIGGVVGSYKLYFDYICEYKGIVLVDSGTFEGGYNDTD